MRNLRLHCVNIKFEWKNFFGWAVTWLIRIIERKSFSHFYPEVENIKDYFYYESHAWDIPGWFFPWKKVDVNILNYHYVPVEIIDIKLTKEETDILIDHFENYAGRRYAVGRLFAIVLYRIIPAKIFLKLPGVTCASTVAEGLEKIGLWNHSCPPKIAGLKEVHDICLKLKDRNI